ncbi:MAG: hypothetical protein A3C43_11445 [Candidatus Schekmanbacteria bacterium RIFCSPHIGHO2_02_FULL_38_11]|uniref:DUF465 domain-containing protein n=1 Tax=Candidatus Schekmanbacteria bacterium RIFCSPLOWO2_12_FULL_38_15 TaxID=1817883 RepID=A0A1F7SJX5_9BACT|nr:MAG: hypothetical protein A2043_05025 [Candidatus Schekmanbacteria bacterium GWA2_38_9]OGL51736.1 MAG: hypothetical protein A3H37_11865 [Candidatus Schekmanbacteria bacterium RIFCSPLOWO2_02_FULL_38_14]OGL52403.1 MAG: hypothetical protein A3C43_11445 [Candidatus Schekmanbacteria bacterium RIFCSPHIGHO2_02_FULL_38_11]OGL54059.1 MAG: hypothetical protein A3G31_04340 [Candidatus Schekmanbacteria bacterium RIFCSPLOWO2_12_FULL_38_15]
MEDIESLIKTLKSQNEEYRNLEKSHKEYEEQLRELDKIRYPSPEETIEINRIKKLKLQGKDRMESILNEFKRKLETSRA